MVWCIGIGRYWLALYPGYNFSFCAPRYEARYWLLVPMCKPTTTTSPPSFQPPSYYLSQWESEDNTQLAMQKILNNAHHTLISIQLQYVRSHLLRIRFGAPVKMHLELRPWKRIKADEPHMSSSKLRFAFTIKPFLFAQASCLDLLYCNKALLGSQLTLNLQVARKYLVAMGHICIHLRIKRKWSIKINISLPVIVSIFMLATL